MHNDECVKAAVCTAIALQLIHLRLQSHCMFRVPLNDYPLRSLAIYILSLLYCRKHIYFTEQSTLVVAMAMNTRSGAPPATPATPKAGASLVPNLIKRMLPVASISMLPPAAV